MKRIANSLVGVAAVFGFLYLAYEINRSLFLTGFDLFVSTFSKKDEFETDNED